MYEDKTSKYLGYLVILLSINFGLAVTSFVNTLYQNSCLEKLNEKHRSLVPKIINAADTNRDGKLDLEEKAELIKIFEFHPKPRFYPEDSDINTRFGYIQHFNGDTKITDGLESTLKIYTNSKIKPKHMLKQKKPQSK